VNWIPTDTRPPANLDPRNRLDGNELHGVARRPLWRTVAVIAVVVGVVVLLAMSARHPTGPPSGPGARPSNDTAAALPRPEHAAEVDAGQATCTTDINGYCTIRHGLGQVPARVMVTLDVPKTGLDPLPDQLATDEYRTDTFRLRAASRVGAYYGEITVSYVAYASYEPTPSPTITASAPDPTTVPLPLPTSQNSTPPFPPRPGTFLTWTPPSLSNPTRVYVSNDSRILTLDSTRDYIIEMPAAPLSSGGLNISGGRNVVLIGGEIRRDPATCSSTTADRALYLHKQTGTVHVEGLLISGANIVRRYKFRCAQSSGNCSVAEHPGRDRSRLIGDQSWRRPANLGWSRPAPD
jgi:hypothetical protein